RPALGEAAAGWASLVDHVAAPAAEPAGAAALLVRPDGHVCWASQAGAEGPRGAPLRGVRGPNPGLGQPSPDRAETLPPPRRIAHDSGGVGCRPAPRLFDTDAAEAGDARRRCELLLASGRASMAAGKTAAARAAFASAARLARCGGWPELLARAAIGLRTD